MVGGGRSVGKRFGQGMQHGVHHGGDHVARRAQRAGADRRDEFSVGYLNLERPEITLIDRLPWGEQVFQRNAGRSDRTTVAPGIERAGPLLGHTAEINHDFFRIHPHLDAHRHDAVQIDAV
eukprot:gene28152-49964_t